MRGAGVTLKEWRAAQGDTSLPNPIQWTMKQPIDQQERNEDKKKPEENPSRGIDPETEEPEMEVEQSKQEAEDKAA